MKTNELARKRRDWEVPWDDALDVARQLKEATSRRNKIANLASTVVNGIIKVLDRNDNYRSQSMRDDMLKTATIMDRMINGELDRKYWVCDLPTGTGKTTLIASYCGYLCKRFDDGVLICVPTLEEIRDLVRSLTELYDVSKSNIFVYTSDPDVNALGCGESEGSNAQICITTQQMIDSRIINVAAFNALDVFKFKGSPRVLKLWDEAILPWREFTLTVYEIAYLPKLFCRYYPEIAERLLTVAEEVRKCERGSYTFPDLLRENGFKHEDFKKDVLSRVRDSDDARNMILALIGLCGNKVRVSKDQNLNTVLSWRNHIPDDFLPVLIFDASGRARAMYDHYAACTKKLEIFTSAVKRYDNVTFHHLNIGAAKDSWRKDAERLINVTAACVDSEPARGCLIIHHKEQKEASRFGVVPDIENELKGILKNKAVEFRTWGKHKQTNAYEHHDKLVLAGLLYLPDRAIEVRARGSNQIDSDAEVEAERLREIELGELKNDILQAVGRIRIRRSVKGENGEAQAPKADVYIMASNNAGCSIPDLLRELFPGCTVRNERVPGAKLRQWEQAVDAIDDAGRDAEEAWVAHSEIMKSIGMDDEKMDDKKNFNRRVRRNADFRAALKELGWEDNGKHFRKLPF